MNTNFGMASKGELLIKLKTLLKKRLPLNNVFIYVFTRNFNIIRLQARSLVLGFRRHTHWCNKDVVFFYYALATLVTK